MKICLDLHDFSIHNNRFDLLYQLKEHYPQAKVTLFTVPVDYRTEGSVQNQTLRSSRLQELKKNLDWLQIVPHGLMHIPNEFHNCDYYTMRDLVMPSIDEAFAKDGLPYEKGFCAPYWLWNEGVVRALDEAGWWGAVDRNQPEMLRTKRFYKYSYSTHEPFWKFPEEVLKLHGHIDGTSENDLELTLSNLLKLPQDAEWLFASEFVDENRSR